MNIQFHFSLHHRRKNAALVGGIFLE